MWNWVLEMCNDFIQERKINSSPKLNTSRQDIITEAW